MPMFPDSGVPAADAKNSLPDVDTAAGCDELWYSTSRCQPRFDPAAANAMLAEQMNLIMKGGVQYDCATLTNVERAVRYTIQRGLARSALLLGGPLAYTGILDPPLTHYNDFMTLTVVPSSTNTGAVSLDFGKGVKSLLRNDGLPLEAGDMKINNPLLIAYYNGAWHCCSAVMSQMPKTATGTISGWVRTDGNDDTGDGTENTAAKAFQTINGAYAKLSKNVAASAQLTMLIQLGIPGTYPAFAIYNAGYNVEVRGDIGNPAAYRIASAVTVFNDGWCGYADSCIRVTMRGLTFVMDRATPVSMYGVRIQRADCLMEDCRFECTANSSTGGFIQVYNSNFYPYGRIDMFGGGRSLQQAIIAFGNSGVSNAGAPKNHQYYFYDTTFSNGTFFITDLSVVGLMAIFSQGIIGPQYTIGNNSILNKGGVTVPGTTAGIVTTGGQVNP